MTNFSINEYKSMFLEPLRIVEPISWIKHIPFAFFIIELLKPRIVVELGVHTGNSFSAFCQAVKNLNVKAPCYGVDTFKGDPHAGVYDESVYIDINNYITENCGDFAQVMRMTFNEALEYFSDGSIDLLHIDGYHTYEAVKHDFESWLPKMSDMGVILLHDTQVRRDEFGAWKLWEEISRLYPSYEFKFGYGLGVLAVGKNVPGEIIKFIDEAREKIFIERLFFTLGSNMEFRTRIQSLEGEVADIKKAIAEKDERVREFEVSLEDRNQHIQSIEGEVAEVRNTIAQKDERVRELEVSLEDRNQHIQSIEGEVSEIRNTIAQKDERVRELEASLEDRNQHIQSIEGEVSEIRNTIAQKDERVRELEASLEDRNQHIQSIEGEVSEIRNTIAQKDESVRELEASLEDRNQHIQSLEGEVSNLRKDIAQKDERVREIEMENLRINTELNSIKSSVTWRTVMKWHSFVEKIVPLGTRRRRWYDLGIIGLRTIANEGWRSFWWKYKYYIKMREGRKKRDGYKIWIGNNEPNKARGGILASAAEETFCLTPSEFRPLGKARIAVVIHVYYIDLFEEICSYLKNIPLKHTLLISVSKEEDQAIIAKQIENLPLVEHAEIRVVENRGRDIAPMLVDFAPFIKDFDYICHIHTKKTLRSGFEQCEWRQYLYEMLLGSRERVQAIFSVFEMDPSVGVIYPEVFDDAPYWGQTWLSNKGIASSLLSKLGIRFDPDEYIDFSAGSMFWARREALEPLLDLGLTRDAFPEEHGQTDGTLHHTIERSFVLASQSRGLKYVVILDKKAHLFSYRSSKNLHHYLSVPLDVKLRTELPVAEVVSFDIFDTLLIRPFASPDMVFDFLEEQVAKEFGLKGFRQIRKESENIARARKHFQDDVKISEIYSVFAEQAKISTSTANKLLELEVSTETAILAPRESVIKLAKEVKDSGKRVILVSDTYLERKYIEEILLAKGINFYDDLYISCEIGKRKDRGNLWEYVPECEGVANNRLLHVGDNEQSDIHLLEERGFMHPVHVMKPSVLFRQSELGEVLWEALKPYKSWRENLLYGMIANLYCSDPSPKELFESKKPLSDPFAFGYTVFGPIVFNFVSWLIKVSAKDHVKQLKFIAREGFLLSQAFESVVTHPTIKNSGVILPRGAYFLCSRRAAIFAALRTEKDIPRLLERHFQGTLRAFFHERLNVSDIATIECRLGADALEQVVYLPKDHNQIFTSIVKVFDVLTRQAEEEREALLQYCIEQGINGSEKVGLVDVGYSGSIQKALGSLLGHPLAGYYFVTDKMASELSSSGSICRAHFGDFVDPLEGALPIQRYSLLMEAVLTAPEGQLVCFRRSPTGVVPVFKEPGISQKEFPTIRRVHEGTLKFVKDMLDLFGSTALDIEFPKDLIQHCYELVITGELEIGSLRSVLAVEDKFCGNADIPVLDWYNGNV